MNKEELIAKCKEIEPDWEFSFINKYFGGGEDFICEIDGWSSFRCNGDEIDFDGIDSFETPNLRYKHIQILTLAQQYFKENENE